MTRAARRPAFSLVEVLIALAITGLLLTASMAALDSSFRGYKYTTDAASGHIASRIVMARIMTMIRTGVEFGPYPDDVFNPVENPVHSTFIEFQISNDGTTSKVCKLERRAASSPETGPLELWYVLYTMSGGAVLSVEEKPMLTNLKDLRFTLEYDVGPRLRRATVDMTFDPEPMREVSIGSDLKAPSTRLVSTIIPRRLD